MDRRLESSHLAASGACAPRFSTLQPVPPYSDHRPLRMPRRYPPRVARPATEISEIESAVPLCRTYVVGLLELRKVQPIRTNRQIGQAVGPDWANRRDRICRGI